MKSLRLREESLELKKTWTTEAKLYWIMILINQTMKAIFYPKVETLDMFLLTNNNHL